MAFTVARPGQVNNAGDDRAMFLKTYSGEVLTAFRRKTAFSERHIVRSISSGKSAQFPAMGRLAVQSHTPGTQITGQLANFAERVITIDDKLIAPVYFDDLDQAMSHYDYRSEQSYQAGEALAQHFDKNVARVGLLTARDTSVVDGLPGGTILEDANFATDSDALAAGIFGAAQSMDEKDVPEDDRWCYVKPAQFYSLAQNTSLINKDWGGAGSLANGVIDTLAAIPIVKTNNLPTTDDSAEESIKDKYKGNFSTTVSLIMHRSAVGTVKLMDLAIEDSGYMVDYQGNLVVAKMVLGSGGLRAPSAVELRTGTPA